VVSNGSDMHVHLGPTPQSPSKAMSGQLTTAPRSQEKMFPDSPEFERAMPDSHGKSHSETATPFISNSTTNPINPNESYYNRTASKQYDQDSSILNASVKVSKKFLRETLNKSVLGKTQ
jgi:hypothetical protein